MDYRLLNPKRIHDRADDREGTLYACARKKRPICWMLEKSRRSQSKVSDRESDGSWPDLLLAELRNCTCYSPLVSMQNSY